MTSSAILSSLPEPPKGKHGWPWDHGSTSVPAMMADGSPWPSMSLIIPSFNQGIYIEETIRSILLQGYPNLELHVIDGGSHDNTLEIIKKYQQWLASWVSEIDSGQSEAINKGFSRCSGDIINWICSDDYLAPDALCIVATLFSQKAIDVVAGACLCQYDDEPERTCIRQVESQNWQLTPYAAAIWQPSCFFRRNLITRKDLVRTSLHFCMDRELWAYLCSMGARWEWVDHPLGVFRFTGENKSVTGKNKIIDELDSIYRDYVKEVLPLPLLLRACWLPLVLIHVRHRSQFVRIVALGASRGLALILLMLYPRVRVRALQREFYEYSVW